MNGVSVDFKSLHTSLAPTHWFGRKRNKATKEPYDLSADECFNILKSIVSNGFQFSTCTENLKLHSEMAKKLQIPNLFGTKGPLISFTDIPLNLSEFHRSKYGSWGISMNRNWLISQRGQPVIYRSAHKEDSLTHRMLLLWQVLNSSEPELKATRDKITPDLWSLLSQITHEFFFSVKHLDHEEGIPCGNYLEREWRITDEGTMTSAKFSAGDVEAIFYNGDDLMKHKILNDPELNDFFSNKLPPIRNIETEQL